jgi:hypothetical protein
MVCVALQGAAVFLAGNLIQFASHWGLAQLAKQRPGFSIPSGNAPGQLRLHSLQSNAQCAWHGICTRMQLYTVACVLWHHINITLLLLPMCTCCLHAPRWSV